MAGARGCARRSAPTWSTDPGGGRYEAPADPDGKRRQPRIGPFDTKDEVEDTLAAELARLGSGAQPTAGRSS
jgi:hypothetical protein